MSKTTYNELTNTTTFKIETPEAFSAFKMGYQSGDYRQFNRHPETMDLKQVVADNQRHSQIVVEFGDEQLLLRTR